MLQRLLANGAEIDQRDTLCLAINGGHELTVRVLLKNGANMHASYFALCSAVAKDHASIAELLIHSGAIIKNETLICAANNQSIKILTILLAHHHYSETIINRTLISAAGYNNAAIVRLLLNLVNDKSSILISAANRGYTSTVKLILDNIDKNMNYNSATAQRALVLAAEKGHDLTVKLLLEYGVKLETKLFFGIWSVANGHKSVYKYLKAYDMHRPTYFPITKLELHDDSDILKRPEQHWRNSAHNIIYHEDVFWSLVTCWAVAQIGRSKGVLLPFEILSYITNFLGLAEQRTIASAALVKVAKINQHLATVSAPQERQGLTTLNHCLFYYPLKPATFAVNFVKAKYSSLDSGLFGMLSKKGRLLIEIAESEDDSLAPPSQAL